MISRLALAIALAASTVALHGMAQAQTGVTAQGAVNSGGASPTGSIGTTSNTPRDNSSSTSTTMGPMGGGTTNSPGVSSPQPAPKTQATQTAQITRGSKAMHRAKGSDMAERQMTECLNNAAAQHTSMDSCKR
jgi:hypothetical protein